MYVQSYCCAFVTFPTRNIPFHPTNSAKNLSLPQSDTLLNLDPVRVRPSDKCRRPWSVREIQMEMDASVPDQPLGPARGLAKGVESQTTAAGHRPVTSSVSSKSTEQQKALRQRDGHLPTARRHLGSASWGWPAASNQQITPPVVLPFISLSPLTTYPLEWPGQNGLILNLVAVGRFVSGLRFNSRVSYCKM